MHIAYVEPLKSAWERMASALFHPFDAAKWLAIGFTAFLAGLGDSGNGGIQWRRGWDRGDWDDVARFPGRAWDWLNDNPGWFIAGLFLLAIIVAIAVVLLWVSSRGKFMFLDNVVRDRAKVAEPWREYARLGDSLFVWRLVFGLIALAAVAIPVVFGLAAVDWFEGLRYGRDMPVLTLVGLGLLVLLLALLIGFIVLLLNDFVVPIMYRDRLKAGQAWRRFLPLLGRRFPHFLLYALLILGLFIAFGAAVVFAGLITCCIGWLIPIIPYIGTVVTLPVWYAYRAFSVEFLGQFGPEYRIFPIVTPPPAGSGGLA